MTKAKLRTELADVKDDKFWQAVRHLWLDMENKDYFA